MKKNDQMNKNQEKIGIYSQVIRYQTLSDLDFQITMINLFKKIKNNFAKELESTFKKNQMENLELKNKTTIIKDSIDWRKDQ